MSSHPGHDDHGHTHGHTHAHGPLDVQAAPQTYDDPAQESLVGALQASFRVLRLLMIVLVVMYLFSGAFRVGHAQQGLILRFGQLHTENGQAVFPPGLHFALPDPFDEKVLLPGATSTRELLITTFLFGHKPEDVNRPLKEIVSSASQLKPGVDGAMITGDRNLSHGRWRVQYQIADAGKFYANIGASAAALDPLLQRLTETAIVRVVGGRRVEEVTYEAIKDISVRVQEQLQKLLKDLDTGVNIVSVQGEAIVPGAVASDYDEVTRAQNERETKVKEAEAHATETLNRAAGPEHAALLEKISAYGAAQATGADAVRLAGLLQDIDAALGRAGGQVAMHLRGAQAEADAIDNRVRQEYDDFTYYVAQYRKHPTFTKLSLWTQMREEILGNPATEVFLVPQSDIIEIWGNRDPQRRMDLEKARIQRMQRGEQ